MRQTNLLKRAMSVALGLVLGASALLAQNITVTGTVTDAMKEPIIGASILQQGTTNGTATDIDGNFTLSVPADALLEISSIGFETRVLKATAKMDVILVEDSEMLNETVVVGYGVQKRESLTGAITQIRSEDIAATKTADPPGQDPGPADHPEQRQAGRLRLRNQPPWLRYPDGGRGRCRPFHHPYP